MPVPPATNSKRGWSTVAGKVNVPTGPSMSTSAPTTAHGKSSDPPSIAISSSSMRVSAARSGEHAMEKGRRMAPPCGPIITACPAMYSNGWPVMSIDRRRERGDVLSTRTSGTVNCTTVASVIERLPGSGTLHCPRSPALALVAIHPAVGRGEECLVAVAIVGKHSRTCAQHHRYAEVGPHFELDAVDRPLQFEPLVFGLFA